MIFIWKCAYSEQIFISKNTVNIYIIISAIPKSLIIDTSNFWAESFSNFLLKPDMYQLLNYRLEKHKLLQREYLKGWTIINKSHSKSKWIDLNELQVKLRGDTTFLLSTWKITPFKNIVVDACWNCLYNKLHIESLDPIKVFFSNMMFQ